MGKPTCTLVSPFWLKIGRIKFAGDEERDHFMLVYEACANNATATATEVGITRHRCGDHAFQGPAR